MLHTTNYQNTMIMIADDSPSSAGEIPPVRGDKKSIANLQFELMHKAPYKYTSDDVLFEVYAIRNEITKAERKAARAQFFSKGQPCLRASPLTKRYGWGVHSDAEGKVALYGAETKEYKNLVDDKKLVKVKAMKSAK